MIRLLARMSLALLLCMASTQKSVAQFATSNVTFLSQLSPSELGGTADTTGADIWGWTDAQTSKDYALLSMSNGTAFVDVTDGANPVYLGILPTHTDISLWRDVKVYQDHAYIVSDFNGPHGLQIFDLTQLRGVTSPQTFSNTAHYDTFRSAHNIAINEDSGFAYVVGSDLSVGGLHILDLQNPVSPQFAGEFIDDGYTHDVQVVTYNGPDTSYAGREIAFASNTDAVTIVDVTNKGNPTMLSTLGYNERGYVHQGWLSEDGNYFYLGDEADERAFGVNTRTHIFDVSDLESPQYIGFHEYPSVAIDHNLYTKDGYIFAANYENGVRILEQTDPANGVLTEVGFIDTFPDSDDRMFRGAWSTYPYFDNGKFIVSDLQRGLFVAQFDLLVSSDGDFDGNSVFDCADIDALTAAVAGGSTDLTYDLNGDGLVDIADRDTWLAIAGEQVLAPGASYIVGDANLDGSVDISDFNIWNANKFTAQPAFCSADFNADGFVDISDFNIWNSRKFQSSLDSAAPVPEPASLGLILLALIGFLKSARDNASPKSTLSL